ncbi:hypothetical protein ACFSO7_09095 [Bacillus sp. CGMCC 1.16607]|uniref:hypothetical protein n=1 Tax=Bacillus sp. CGMCC 1.16607 TaxID=3351842 RepID=UPI003635D0A0
MRKLFSFSVIILLFLVGCQNTKNGILDTSKLSKVEMQDVAEEQENHIPSSYKAPSVKVGLEAIPFKMTLPKNLPFDAKPFQPPTITTNFQDNKKVRIEFSTNSKNKKDKIILGISAFNGEFLEMGDDEADKISLNNEIQGYYNQNLLKFYSNGISYLIHYKNDTIPKNQHKKDMIKLANQILE